MDDQQHRKDEHARREKRKNAKKEKSESQREKERKRKEHAEKILGSKAAGGGKKQKTFSSSSPGEIKSSAFQALFKAREQGFQISFKFRNAPPRPPVGPCFIGTDLEETLKSLSEYKPNNAVEQNYRWKLHHEPDLGVPLAPSAMDPKLYQSTSSIEKKLHPDDLNLLDWEGSMGDTAAELLKKSRDNTRAADRLALLGKTAMFSPNKSKASDKTMQLHKKGFRSRVLHENMPNFMKKTTYITNDYSRNEHDHKSQAVMTDELAEKLEFQQKQIDEGRSAAAVSKTFDDCKRKIVRHPVVKKKDLQPVAEMPLLPDFASWSDVYTMAIIEKPPEGEADGLEKAMVANVRNSDDMSQPRTCQVFVPRDGLDYQAVSQYALDILPLKDGDGPTRNFLLRVDADAETATYNPLNSQLKLRMGRPIKDTNMMMQVTRRPHTEAETTKAEKIVAEEGMDLDLEQKYELTSGTATASGAQAAAADEDDDDDDF